MRITVEFYNLEEMNTFAARILDGGLKSTESVPVKTKTVKEAKTKKSEEQKSEPAAKSEEKKAELEEKKTYTFTEVRAALAGIAKTDSKKVKEILNEFGADKLSDIKEEDYSAVMERAGV